jgi:hypothetical protein
MFMQSLMDNNEFADVPPCMTAPGRKSFVGGNWKCNGTSQSIAELVSGLGGLPTTINVDGSL